MERASARRAAEPEPEVRTVDEEPRPERGPRRWPLWLALGLLVLVAGVVLEARTSFLQSRLVSRWAADIGFGVEPGPAADPVRAPDGPYDERLGYAALPLLTERLEQRGFAVISQARPSGRLAESVARGMFPVYAEKSQAGLEILDRDGATLYHAIHPERVYESFGSIPPLVVRALLFIENRALLDPPSPYHNPAIEWDRLAGSVLMLGARRLGAAEGSVSGASTLATQIEKFRHSPRGITTSPGEKLRQMATATVRAYADGPRTESVRRRIVLDYLNSVPLAAVPGHGEVIGLNDGLWAWYGLDAAEVNELLMTCGARPGEPACAGVRDAEVEGATGADVEGAAGADVEGEAGADVEGEAGADVEGAAGATADLEEVGPAFRAVLHLLLAQRRPTFYLAQTRGHPELQRLGAVYLDLMHEEGVISPGLAEAARAARPEIRPRSPERTVAGFVNRKAINAVRTRLLGLTGRERLYELDRLDLTAHSTIDRAVQDSVARTLRRLQERDFVRASGLDAPRLLGSGDPGLVLYSFVLYESTPRGNLVRIQTDNFDGPFDLNQSSRLELGSTAKLRTLVTYLEAVERLHAELAELDPAARRSVADSLPDPLTRWAVETLNRAPQITLADFLDRAMERRYSASPGERFFTGGGTHVFRNFDNTFDGSVVSVREGFRNSVNLVFVRIMRDLERFYRWRVPGASARILEDPSDPRRQAYLERFADREGTQFLTRFHRKYAEADPDSIPHLLVDGRRLTPQRLAWGYRSVRPDAELRDFELFLRAEAPNSDFTERVVQDLFRRTDVSQFSLADRGYLAGIHPLEIWVARYLIENPGATRDSAVAASREARMEVYRWLFSPRRRGAQDRSISVILELEAFLEIQRAWQRLGYPFENVVPSYGSSIGSSGDRPGALAELVGIVLNDGIRRPTVLIDRLEFATGTPYETTFGHEPWEGERVMSVEVARATRAALLDVVSQGTARFVQTAVRLPDGTPVTVGGKTGTGNNQFKVFAAGGRLVEARTINRTATFVFLVGERHFGVVTTHVPGADAAAFTFTSALPVRVLALLGPHLGPLVDRAGAETPAAR